MLKLLLVGLFLTCPLSTLFFANGYQAPSPTTPIFVSGQDYTGVIFPANSISDLSSILGIQDITYHSPSAEEIAELEAQLPEFLAAHAEAFNRDILSDLPNYARQYLGYTADSADWIYLNALCNRGEGFDWEQSFVFVADGGDCFFQVVYNQNQQEFQDLMINGEA